jgi:hypothetical protein
MKFIALALMFSLPAFAKTVDVECKIISEAFRNQFTIEFSFDDEATTFEDKAFDFTMRPNGRNPEITELSLVRSGTITVIPGGEITKYPFMILTSVDKEEEVQYMNLVVNYPEKLTSTIRFKNGMAYNSTCTTK